MRTILQFFGPLKRIFAMLSYFIFSSKSGFSQKPLLLEYFPCHLFMHPTSDPFGLKIVFTTHKKRTYLSNENRMRTLFYRRSKCGHDEDFGSTVHCNGKKNTYCQLFTFQVQVFIFKIQQFR